MYEKKFELFISIDSETVPCAVAIIETFFFENPEDKERDVTTIVTSHSINPFWETTASEKEQRHHRVTNAKATKKAQRIDCHLQYRISPRRILRLIHEP
ncbi:hypothetical protein TNCT_135741 [Trichonephila clavata]|uniref:Uncharacterized protein n=1 Tax=Trichonephila clavata TaxID=2740835 RepID=A0A8X6LVW8_TRICU|nr:hypothetical protein TNCT_135741 [Trichonephila clavata]